jgi:hypothetical protein
MIPLARCAIVVLVIAITIVGVYSDNEDDVRFTRSYCRLMELKRTSMFVKHRLETACSYKVRVRLPEQMVNNSKMSATQVQYK